MFRLIPAVSACIVVLLTTVLWGAEPKEKIPFTYRLTKKSWKRNDKPALLCDQKGFAVLSGFDGETISYKDFMQVRVDEQRNWYLLGKNETDDLPLSGQALAIDRMTPRLFTVEAEVFEWKQGQKPVKMIAADRGVCYLSMLTGFFGSNNERVWIEKRDDGFYWLNGKTGEKDEFFEIGAQAIALKFNRGQGKKVTASNHHWSGNGKPIEIFPKASGLCFITGVGGALAGGESSWSLDVNAKDVWVISGKSTLAELEIDLIGLRWDEK